MLRSRRQSIISLCLPLIVVVFFATTSGQAQDKLTRASSPAAGQATMVPERPVEGRSPDYLVKAAEIQKVGDMEFWRAMNYLLPELFPRKESAWHSWLQRYVFYVDTTKMEPEEVENLPTEDVTEIAVWDSRVAPAPMAFPAIAHTRYIVSIETKPK
jgi:hypothetical protein